MSPVFLPKEIKPELDALLFGNKSQQDIDLAQFAQSSQSDIDSLGASLKLGPIGSPGTSTPSAVPAPSLMPAQQQDAPIEAPSPQPLTMPASQIQTAPTSQAAPASPDISLQDAQSSATEDASPPSSVAAPAPSTGDDRAQARAEASKNGVDPDVYEHLIDTESRFNRDAVNPSGASGLAQFMPATARALGIDPNDPEQALAGGAKYLRQLLDQFGGDYTKALAAYNWGPGNVASWSGALADLPGETQQYVSTILGNVAQSRAAPKPDDLPDIPQRSVPSHEVSQAEKRYYDLSNITPNQFEEGKALGLDPEAQAALCGIAGAVALQRAAGQDADFGKTYQMAQNLKEWSSELGMVHGSQGEIALLSYMNVPARLGPLSPQRIADEVQAGRPVEINAQGGGGHFFVASGVRQGENGLEFNFGNSAAILRRSGGQTWWRLDQLAGLGVGTPREAIYLGSEAT